ncbi:MAG: hypothetical protein ACOC8F_05475 [Planctomycetota bacterium]
MRMQRVTFVLMLCHLAGLACAAAPGAGPHEPARQAEPTRREIIAAMLRRSRLLSDAHFEVPRAVYSQFIRQTRAPAEAPAAPVGVIAALGRYTIRTPDAGADGEAVDLFARVRLRVLDADKARNLAVLNRGMRWSDVRVNGEPAEIACQDGWYRLTAPAPGVYEVTARAALPECGLESGGVELAILRTVRTLVALRSPRRLRATAGGRTIRAPDDGPTRTLLALRPRDRLEIVYGPPARRHRRPPQFHLSGAAAWHVGVGRQLVAAQLDVAIHGGPAERIELSVPASAERVSVSGPDVRDVRVAGGRVTCHLRGRIAGRTRLRLSYRLPPMEDATASFVAPQVASGRWTDGTLVVTTTAEREIVEGGASGLRPLAIAEIPETARALLAGTPALAYAITSPRFSLSADVLDLGAAPMRESVADLGHFRLSYRADGSVLTRAEYEIRNRTRQFLTVRLPRGARLLLAKVNDEQRPVAPIHDDMTDADAYLLPLVRSTASVEGLVSFPVEIVYVTRAAHARGAERTTLPLPRIDLPVAYAWCEAYVPRAMRIEGTSGAMRRVERYASETAAARLTYGVGQLAAGYDEADRVGARRGALSGLTDATTQPEPTATTTRPDSKLQTKAILARNYYRAGQLAYQRGEYDEALGALRNVAKLAPETPFAANAQRLMSNIDVARGKFKAESREQKLAAARVRKETAQTARQPLAERQHQALERLEEARRSGDTGEALSQAKVARSLGRKLLERGAAKREQAALMERLEAQTEDIRRSQARQFEQARQELSGLERAGRHAEAMRKAREARELAEQLDAKDDVTELNKRMEALAVASANQAETEEPGDESDVGAAVWGGGSAGASFDGAPQAGSNEVRAGEEGGRGAEGQRTAVPFHELRDIPARYRQRPDARPGRPGHAPTAEPAANRIARRKLDRTITLDADETSFADAVNFLRNVSGVNMWVNWKALDLQGVGKDTPVAVHLSGEPVRKALEAVLADAGGDRALQYVISDGVVTISTRDDLQRRTSTRVYDVRGLSVPSTRHGFESDWEVSGNDAPVAAADDVLQAGVKELAETVREATRGDAFHATGDEAVRTMNGRLVVQGTALQHRRVERLLRNLRDARGRQVELGERIARQRAGGKLAPRGGEAAAEGGWAYADADEDGARLDKEFLSDVQVNFFLQRNYRWQGGTGGRLSRRQRDELARTLRFNRGQKVYLQSRNIAIGLSAAAQLGTEFRTVGGVAYAVVDEAQLRTLRQLARRRGAADVPDNPTAQETIVGTDALLANDWRVNVAYAADEANTLFVRGSPVAVPHERILLIANDGALTAVKAGPMQHWTEPPEAEPLAEVPAEIHVPAVGRLIKTEKTLVQPSDRLEIVLDYSWQGDAK